MNAGSGPKALVTVAFRADKKTKNTFRFTEIMEGTNIKVGTIYVPKATLTELGWDETKNLVVSLEVE